MQISKQLADKLLELSVALDKAVPKIDNREGELAKDDYTLSDDGLARVMRESLATIGVDNAYGFEPLAATMMNASDRYSTGISAIATALTRAAHYINQGPDAIAAQLNEHGDPFTNPMLSEEQAVNVLIAGQLDAVAELNGLGWDDDYKVDANDVAFITERAKGVKLKSELKQTLGAPAAPSPFN